MKPTEWEWLWWGFVFGLISWPILDQMKAKIEKKELAPKWGGFTIGILHQFDLQSRWTLMLLEGF